LGKILVEKIPRGIPVLSLNIFILIASNG